MYNPSSENKGADQLRGYRKADLRLCFRLYRLLVFPWGGSNNMLLAHVGDKHLCTNKFMVCVKFVQGLRVQILNKNNVHIDA